MLSIRKLSLILAPALVFAGIVHPSGLDRAEASTCVGSLFASGDGSDADPYVINTAEQFRNIRSCDGTNNLVFSIRQNIDLGGEASPLQPFGDSAPFTSEIRGEVFDGTNTVSARIEGIYVNGADAGIIKGANVGTTIKGLVVSGNIVGTSGYIGGLIGQITATSAGSVLIQDVKSSLTVHGGGTTRGVGGLVGYYLSNHHDTSASSSLIVSASEVIYSEGSGRLTLDPSADNNMHLGGILAYSSWINTPSFVHMQETQTSTVIEILDGPLNLDFFLGGLVGELYGVSGSFHRVGSSSLIQVGYEPRSGSDKKAYIGGLIGESDRQGYVRISEGFFSGLIKAKGRVSAAPFISEMKSNSLDISFSISNSYSVGTIVQEDAYLADSSFARFGGLSGFYSDSSNRVTATVSDMLLATNFLTTRSVTGSIFGNAAAALNLTDFNVFYNTSSEASGTTKKVGTGTDVTGATAITSTQQASSGTFTSFSNTVWGFCPEPYLLWQGAKACNPSVTGGRVSEDGNTLEVFFSQPIGATTGGGERFPEPGDVFSVRKNGVSMTLTGAIQPGTASRAVFVPLPETVSSMDDLDFAYTDPSTSDEQQSEAIEAISDGADVASRDFILAANTSKVAGPAVSNLASSNPTPTSFDLSFTCGGSCDQSASYAYEASITPAGGSATTQTATTSGTATLSFNNLDPNVAHVISVTVTQGGLTSPAATLNVTTPKPIATISAISVLDVSATLTVGCTNCGAAPDSFTVSATPVAGGAAITSNTSVISSLSPETTYSFSVVVAFAGTTSDVVLWQNNPVMTLPLVPVVSAVSPTAVPLSGGTITVTGANFTTSSLLTLGGTSSAFTIVSGTEITFSAPSGTAGSFDLAITNPVGTFTLSNAITYVSGPSLTTNSPVLATTNGGTIVTLTGTDLATTNQVNVGSTTVSFSVVSDTAVRFTTAATTAGIVDIGVVTVGGPDTLSSAIEFTTSALVPVIGAIAPVTGPTAGGTTITVTGQYFSGSYSDSVSAAINGVSGSSIVLIDDSTLTFVSPPGAAATGLDVTVATGGGSGTLAGAFTYTAPPAPSSTPGSAPPVVINTPTITEFSTREISASGAEVIATGQRLENLSVLTLGGITVTIVSNTATSLTFTTGEMPVGVWDLRLVGSNGTLVFQQAIEVVEATAIVAESTGELLGYTWTFKFLGNSRSLHLAQREHLTGKLDDHSTAETIICWGYTTAENPNAWAIAHATQRAQAACDMASANNSEVKTVVRLRYGVSKNWAMRSALQFWR